MEKFKGFNVPVNHDLSYAVSRFNAGGVTFNCLDADCDDLTTCDKCIFCCNFGAVKAKCKAFKEYAESKGYKITRRGYATVKAVKNKEEKSSKASTKVKEEKMNKHIKILWGKLWGFTKIGKANDDQQIAIISHAKLHYANRRALETEVYYVYQNSQLEDSQAASMDFNTWCKKNIALIRKLLWSRRIEERI